MVKRTLRSAVSMSISWRGLLISILFLITIFLFSACGEKIPTTNNSDNSLTLATTTSVNDSGLLDYLRPEFERETGITLKVIAQGTGQAVKTGENGDADVLLIHDKKSEEKFVNDGHGLKRIELMYNYFVIVGQKDDPAEIKKSGLKDASDALKKIMYGKYTFVSRGDDSGTHKKEISLWKKHNLEPSGDWYVSAGKGMGAVLTMAGEKKAYTLTDKATYLSMKDKLDLDIVLENANDLKNQYTVIAVNPEKHAGINNVAAERFINWITSEKVLKMIGDYGKDKYGQSLFTVNYVGK